MILLVPSQSPGSFGDAMGAVEVKVEHDGRVFLPADLRRHLAVQPGDTLLVDMTDEGMLLWTREVAANKLQGLVSGSVPAVTSLGGELRLMQHDEGITVERHSRANSSRSARGRG
jgi:bifunctional DNA-binding transcriptional regulator/antitoxin component of YhaV-PrlF toxin-antitoxin module